MREPRHPLPKIVSEVKRQYGDVAIALDDESPAETEGFVDALVDSEPNRLEADLPAADPPRRHLADTPCS